MIGLMRQDLEVLRRARTTPPARVTRLAVWGRKNGPAIATDASCTS